MNEEATLLEPILLGFPLELIGVLLVVLCLVAREFGTFLSRWGVGRCEGDPSEKAFAKGYICDALFALLAFMIGLTFSMAVSRHDTRRLLVAEEASAISTAYLRAGLLDQPAASRIQALLRAYARTRIAPEWLWHEGMTAQMRRSTALRTRIWDETRLAMYPVRTTALASYFVGGVNDMLNVGTRRQLAGRAHLPTRILDILVLNLLVSAGVIGYLTGSQLRGLRPASTLLLVLFAITIVLILDLDRPRVGMIDVPQAPIEELVALMDRDARRPQPVLPPAPNIPAQPRR